MIKGNALSFFPRTESLGVVLPNNSPGVHSLWVPAIPLKIPLVLKPGSAEPWTPFRIIQAFIEAGLPREVFSFYPTDHAGSNEILNRCGRGMIFGDVGSTGGWANDPRRVSGDPAHSFSRWLAHRRGSYYRRRESSSSLRDSHGRASLRPARRRRS